MIVVDPIHLHSIAHLESVWRSMTDVARHNIFLSWPWIRTWLSLMLGVVKPALLQIKENDALIGVAIIVNASVRRRGALDVNTWSLHATGLPELDAIFIEHNGLLAPKGREASAWSEWAEAFTGTDHDWDEINLRGVSPTTLDVWKDKDVCVREDMTLTSRFVDLAQIRERNLPFVETLGRSTRARIRYTARSLSQEYGQVELREAANSEEALEYFDELKQLHQRQWTERGKPGAFSNPHFELFHTTLIREHFSEKIVQLLRVCAGWQTVGVLYNFAYDSDVSMYQSGFDYRLTSRPSKLSPGLLAHALAIEHNIAAGMSRYDFLAGDNQYKRVLSNASESLWWGRVQRRRAKFYLEDSLAYMWRLLRFKL